jgi:hypothetical protein
MNVKGYFASMGNAIKREEAELRRQYGPKTYTIDDAIREVAECMQHDEDKSTTTIRCALNDTLDDASKSGFEIADDETGFGYDQPAAVAEVKRLIGEMNG